MVARSVDRAGKARVSALLGAALSAHGSAAHAYFASAELLRGPTAARNLADAVHFLCTLHGRHPGVIDLAIERTRDEDARAWLAETADAFAAERLSLTKLAVAAGPVPGTPDGGASEAAVIAQRAAIATLASSERNGCALGAALGLAADWVRIRAVLELAARRLEVEVPESRMPSLASIEAQADAVSGAPVERALLFGAEQILVQHHGLWALLEAREQARRLHG